jgi:hypothetical protein
MGDQERFLLIISVADGKVSSVDSEGFKLPQGTEVIVRDFDRGDTPDANGDLYEDEVLS